jgi:hypothetical protein
VDAHREGKRFVVRADEKLTAFLELESAIRVASTDSSDCGYVGTIVTGYTNFKKR